MASGKTADAIVAYQHALAKDSLKAATSTGQRSPYPDSLRAEILARLSKAYSLQKNYANADRYLRLAMNIPFEKGLHHLESGDEEAAIRAFEHTLEIHPQHPLALNRLGDLVLSRKQEDKALEYYEQSAQANPTFSETFIKLGQLYAGQNAREKAKQAFEHAIQMNINAVDAYLGLGQLLLQEEEWAAAAAQFDKVLLIKPKHTVALKALKQARRHL